MASTSSVAEDPIKASFFEHFSCKICLEILKKPVQCRRNEHYFCTTCVTKHLARSKTCPLCMDELTVETLRPIPRVVADLLSQYDVPLCKYVQRGCKIVVKHQDLPFHHEVCGFAPVLCSNEGCDETVNKQDKINHEKESCEFRKIKCEVCDEKTPQRDHVKHSCVLRQELDEMKLLLGEIQGEVKGHGESIKNLQDPLRSASSSLIRQERRIILNGQIVVAGGHGRSAMSMRSYEVFNWSTKSWTLFENVLFFDHRYSFSFPYNNNIMICGGKQSKRIEYLDMTNSRAFSSPASLPCHGKGVLWAGKQIITFGNSVSKTSLKPPCTSRTSLQYDDGEERINYAVECVNEGVVVVGGHYRAYKLGSLVMTNNVLFYNPATNELKKLAPLPYEVSLMATAPYKDNIIIIGGQTKGYKALNSVIMYNVTSQECKMLPSMLQARRGCAAVIMGDVIVVMGGDDDGDGVGDCVGDDWSLNTVEYHVLGEDSWKELPPMHCRRGDATASVKV